MKVIEGECPFRDYLTWYRVTGSLEAAKTPLVVVHGGPGCTHDYVDSLKDVVASGRAVIHYDQLGNGRSTHLPDAPPSFWTVDLFLSELATLLRHLDIAGNYALYGQSWGGMLSSEHAVRRPAGLRSLIIANSPSSMPVWVAEANRLRLGLPAEVQETLTRHERAGTTASEEYQKAARAFYARHVCRLDPWPPEVKRTFDAMDRDPTVYLAMNGPTEFHVIGTLRDWTIVDRLDRINVPTLVLSGRYDEATPLVVAPFAERIPRAKWVMFEESSHMPHVEEREHCMEVVVDFLDRQDIGS
jgi:L-proline amide hydrolase